MARLREKPLPAAKSAELKVAFDSVPTTGDIRSFIRDIWAEKTAKKVVRAGYKERPKETDTALGTDVVKNGSEHQLNLETLECACLFRNCVVHNAGVADERTLDAAGTHTSGLKLGEKLPLDEKRLFDFFEAMLAHARDVDLLVRTASTV